VVAAGRFGFHQVSGGGQDAQVEVGLIGQGPADSAGL
jgi:hypothetical protein